LTSELTRHGGQVVALAKETLSGGTAAPGGEKAGGGPQLIGMRRYAKAVQPQKESGLAALAGGDDKKPRIALITAVGTIVRGIGDPTARNPQIGGDSVAAAVRSAYSDPLVKAIVVRVDSPGGSAVASDTIRRELARAREAGVPVVVSMAGVAASGGYYIATGADKVVAQPGTITGSIGCASPPRWRVADRTPRTRAS
jgi:protease-4